MLIFLKLFISSLSRRIVRIDRAQEKEWLLEKAEQWLAGKGLLRERHLCATFKLYKNSFCQQRAGLEVLIKVTSKADRWKQSGKSFTKNWFLIAFFSIAKIVFHLMFAKIFYLIPTHVISSQRSQILQRKDTSYLCNIGTRSKPCDVSWVFRVYLYQIIQYKLFQELRIHLSADSYLWSLRLVVNIVKAMFKSIFLSLIFTLVSSCVLVSFLVLCSFEVDAYFFSFFQIKFLRLVFFYILPA